MTLLCAAALGATPPPYVYITGGNGYGAPSVAVLNWKTQQIVTTVPVPGGPIIIETSISVAANPNGEYVYGLVGANGSVPSYLDASTKKILASAIVAGGQPVDAGSPAISEDGSIIYSSWVNPEDGIENSGIFGVASSSLVSVGGATLGGATEGSANGYQIYGLALTPDSKYSMGT